MTAVLTPLLLQLAFYVVLVLEFIIPSGGVLLVLAGLSLGASWWSAFAAGVPGLVTAMAVFDTIGIPVVLFVGFRMLQKSSLANRHELSSEDGFVAGPDLTSDWQGKEGVTAGVLKLGGKVEIEGQILDANSNGAYLESGVRVRVVSVSQGRLIVEPISQGGST